MAFEFDKSAWQPDGPATAEASGQARLDWGGLQARLLATCEAGRELAASRADGGDGGCGSFSSLAARSIESFSHSSGFVNPNDSANRNADRGIDVFVADEFRIGVRG